MNAQLNVNHIELLFHAASGDMRNVRRMIANGTNPNTKDYDNRTALHLAVSEGKDDIVKYLVLHGANVNTVDRFGNSPIDEAKKYQRTEIQSFLAAYSK